MFLPRSLCVWVRRVTVQTSDSAPMNVPKCGNVDKRLQKRCAHEACTEYTQLPAKRKGQAGHLSTPFTKHVQHLHYRASHYGQGVPERVLSVCN